jgi:hypothetical protein
MEHQKEQFEKLKKGKTDLPPIKTDENGIQIATGPKEGKKKKLTTAKKLMLITESFHFFKDSSGKPWAKILNSCYPVRSTPFKRRLQRFYYQTHGKTPYSQALQDVIDQSEAKALFDSPVEDINVRVASEGDKIIVDRMAGRITIEPDGWKISSATGINFWHPEGLNELPMPEHGDDGKTLLKKYLNFETDVDFKLLWGWLLAAYNPEIPCPILNFQGEQGSAKSTNTKVLRSLIDPSGAMINPAPRNEEELIISAQNSRILCLDNLSGLKKWLSDALCRICTGTGFATRRHYTGDEQQIFQVQRPIILNGIDDIATRGDLLDRSIVLNLPSIPPEKRQDERRFWGAFQTDRPQILAAIFDTLAKGLAADRPHLNELPRMADFAEWIVRCEGGLSILQAYSKNKDNAIQAGLDGDYLAIAIRKILNERARYKGSATQLCEKIRYVSTDTNEKYLPTTQTLKSRLTRIGPPLREIGISWHYQRTGGSRSYILEKAESDAETQSEEVPF